MLDRNDDTLKPQPNEKVKSSLDWIRHMVARTRTRDTSHGSGDMGHWTALGLGLGFKLHVRRSVYTLSIRSGLINYKSAAH